MVMKEVNRRRMRHIKVQIGLGFKMKKRATDCEGFGEGRREAVFVADALNRP